MLSILLKPLLGRKKDIREDRVLHPDTEFSLSLIDSGCLFAQIGGRPALIIKEKRDDLNIIKEFQTITIDFELIEKEEFPSLAFFLNISGKSGKRLRFEYFLSMESGEEKELLCKLFGERRIDIILYDTGVDFVILAEIPEAQAEELRSLLSGRGR